MARCALCGKKAAYISEAIGYCGPCVKEHFQEIWPRINLIHHKSRAAHGLPIEPPRDPKGVQCSICMHGCRIPEGGLGYCGVRSCRGGRLVGGRPLEGRLSWYKDPLPTNCVADWVCPGGTGCGYPVYSKKKGAERGWFNLAVFYHSCSFNCLYCQNHHYRDLTFSGPEKKASVLAGAVDESTTCICFFGGDPSCQVLHALSASKLARKAKKGELLRICWETNGSVSEPYLSRMAAFSLESGGCIKVDLKAWHDGIHHVLCGVSNRHTLESFQKLASWIPLRPEPPLLVASTLLVPGYVDPEEVGGLAAFIKELDPEIPYTLLAFSPQFWLRDLPTTSREHANQCLEAAKNAGLLRVRLGNVHLLGPSYEDA